MRFLLTGGAGFIGSHLADKLIATKNEVFIIDNFLTGRKDNIPAHAEFIEGSIYNSNALGRAFSCEPEVVIHCAASYHDPYAHECNLMTNALGSKMVADKCLKTGVEQLIYFQTSLCYGRTDEYPIKLDHPISPICSYAISKTAGELYIRSSGVPFTVFRLANIYGPRNLSGPVPIFYKNLKENKTSWVSDTRRDYVYIDDLVNLVVRSFKKKALGIFHVSSDKDIDMSKLFSLIKFTMRAKANAKLVKRGPDDIEHLFLDATLTRETFNWKPYTGYLEGLKNAVEWYNTHDFKQTYTHLEKPK